MPAAAAIPSIIGAVGGIGGSLLGRKSVQASTQPSAEEKGALTAQTGAANQLTKTGKTFTDMAAPQLRQAGGYFSTLASGNRAATAQQLAPDVQNLNDVYGGTANTLSRFLRGPERGVQMAESERERAGQVSSLFRNARPQANSMLAGLGTSSAGIGAGATGGAASIFRGVSEQGSRNRLAGANLEHQAGSDFGDLMFNILKLYSGGGSKPKATPNSMGGFGA